MAQLTKLKALQKKIQALKDYAEEYKETVLEPKKDWLEEKSDNYKESESGQAWESHLYEIEEILDAIDNIDIDSHVEN